MSRKYKFYNPDGVYFISFAVVEWLDARLTGRAGVYTKRIQSGTGGWAFGWLHSGFAVRYAHRLPFLARRIVMKNYRDLEIYNMAYDQAIKVHKMSLTLPKFELYEQGSQVRRSSKSIKDNIAEGYGRRRYKDEFVRFLIFAHSSCDETLSQLTMINELYFENKGLTELIDEYDLLGARINKFIQYVENNWKAPTRNP